MDEARKERREAAIEAILPIAASLSESEWKWICAHVDAAYSSRAAKVRLDGSDIESLRRFLRMELLGEPYGSGSKTT